MSENIKNIAETQLTTDVIQERLDSALASVDYFKARDAEGFVTTARTAEVQINNRSYEVSATELAHEGHAFKTAEIRALNSSDDEDARGAGATTIAWELLPGAIRITYTGFENGRLVTKDMFVAQSDTDEYQRILAKFDGVITVVE